MAPSEGRQIPFSSSSVSSRELSASSRLRRRRVSALSSKPKVLTLRPCLEHAVGEPGEERDTGDEEPVRERHVDVAGTFLGRVRYLLCDALGRHALRAPATLFVPRAPRVLPEGRAGRAWIDAGDGDAHVGHLHPERVGDRIEGELARAIGADLGDRTPPDYRRDIDYAPPLPHVRQGGLDAVQRAYGVDLEYVSHVFWPHLGDPPRETQPGIVDQHVKGTELPDGQPDHRLDGAPVRNVGLDGECQAAGG